MPAARVQRRLPRGPGAALTLVQIPLAFLTVNTPLAIATNKLTFKQIPRIHIKNGCPRLNRACRTIDLRHFCKAPAHSSPPCLQDWLHPVSYGASICRSCRETIVDFAINEQRADYRPLSTVKPCVPSPRLVLLHAIPLGMTRTARASARKAPPRSSPRPAQPSRLDAPVARATATLEQV
jgi:hypothetical protein